MSWPKHGETNLLYNLQFIKRKLSTFLLVQPIYYTINSPSHKLWKQKARCLLSSIFSQEEEAHLQLFDTFLNQHPWKWKMFNLNFSLNLAIIKTTAVRLQTTLTHNPELSTPRRIESRLGFTSSDFVIFASFILF